jgi:iron complex outermembrane recepter protein
MSAPPYHSHRSGLAPRKHPRSSTHPFHPPRPSRALTTLCLGTLGSLLVTGGVHAQSATSAASGSAAGAVALDTITVTATRRSESLQQVPVAVSVINGESAEQDNLNTLGALSTEVPSLNFRTGSSNKDTSLFIRGVGTISTSPGVEPTVATVIDGVVLARPGQSTADLIDAARIEVLRGPQGTLFGKNASAGVVNIVSRPPSSTLERYVSVDHYGGGNETRVRAGVSGALGDWVTASLSLLRAHEDGNVRNVDDDTHVNGYDKRGARGRLDIDASRDTHISLIADVLVSHDDIPNGVVTRTSLTAYPDGTVTSYPAFAAALSPVTASDDNREVNTNLKSGTTDRNLGLSAQVDTHLGDFILTSITAWRGWNNTQRQDGDRLSAATVDYAQSHDTGQLDFDQVSQELRIASPRGPNLALDYQAGLFYLHTRDRELYRRDVLRVDSSGTEYSDWGLADYGTVTDSTALFGEGRWAFAPQWRALLGLRVTDDFIHYDHVRTRSTPDASFSGAIPGVNAAFSATGATHDTGVSGRTGVQYQISPQDQTYLTYSRGYKGPAFNVFFNMQDRDTLALKPETSDSLEWGLKSESFQQRLRTNLAVFYSRYDNYQANFYDTVSGAVVTRLINAGRVSTRGVELDVQAQATDALRLAANAAYTRARIDEFNCPSGATSSCDVNGKPLPFSPDWRVNLRADYTLPLSNGWQVDLGTNYRWQSQEQFDIGQYADTRQGAYGIWDASAALSSPTAGWRLGLVVKNLLDKSYASYLARGSYYVNRWVPRDDQRYVGLQARYDF